VNVKVVRDWWWLRRQDTVLISSWCLCYDKVSRRAVDEFDVLISGPIVQDTHVTREHCKCRKW